MYRVVALAILTGCGVNLETRSAVTTDAGAMPDAAPIVDARPCVGGDLRATGPDGSCLMMVTAPQTWAAAKQTCLGLDAHPAILATAELDTAAEALVGALDTFIGLTDEVEEGRFVWLDGSALGFANWHTGEPNDGGGAYPEDCAIIAGARAGKQWDDRPCAPVANVGGGSYAVLCQR